MTGYSAPGGGASGGLIGFTQYNPGANVSLAPPGAALTDVDSVHLIVGFNAPTNGKVMVRLTARANVTNTALQWGLRDASGIIAGTLGEIAYSPDQVNERATHTMYVANLVSGVAYSYRFAHAKGGATGTTSYGGNDGAAIMEVWPAL